MSDIDELLAIMARLRDPDTGCPWDVKQDFATIAPYTIEEAFEVADAIERGDLSDLRGELGDLLLQVVFHARMAEERGAFRFADVVATICEKMVRRHPHVFAGVKLESEADLASAWEEEKRRERGRNGEGASALDGVARALPALMRAAKLQRRAIEAGFRWHDVQRVVEKVREELSEWEDALAAQNAQHVEEELGDLLFACVGLGAYSGVDAEQALRRACTRFEQRFQRLERKVRATGREVAELPEEELLVLWASVKTLSRTGESG